VKTIVPGIAAYMVSHAVAVVTVVASLAIAFRLLKSRRTSQSTLAWLLALALVPFVAIPLYLLLGSRKFPRRAKLPVPGAAKVLLASVSDDVAGPIARVLRKSDVAPPRRDNAFELLTTGEAAYARLMGLIRGAERSIDLTMFILGSDATGNAFVEALAERASHGVAVRLILDAVGSSRSCRHATRVLGAAGAEVRPFMPLRHSPIQGRTNLRSHRKLGIVDRHHVFAGGMNLANEYMGPPIRLSSAPRWRDVAAIASGRVAADAEALFESDWGFVGGSKRAPMSPSASAVRAARGDATLQIVPSGPDMTTDTVYDLFLTAIFCARQRIAIVTPYYVPDELLQHALLLSARRGVRTEIVVPARSNHRIADVARRPLLRELHDAGVIVHYYGHGMVHAKAMVVDDAFAYVGSPNFDMRSLFLNYENALCAYSPEAIGQIRSFVDGLIGECAGPPAFSFRPRWAGAVAERMARLLAPEL
jgi:cardiolipin synthase